MNLKNIHKNTECDYSTRTCSTEGKVERIWGPLEICESDLCTEELQGCDPTRLYAATSQSKTCLPTGMWSDDYSCKQCSKSSFFSIST